jgi:hypothetical protein
MTDADYQFGVGDFFALRILCSPPWGWLKLMLDLFSRMLDSLRCFTSLRQLKWGETARQFVIFWGCFRLFELFAFCEFRSSCFRLLRISVELLLPPTPISMGLVTSFGDPRELFCSLLDGHHSCSFDSRDYFSSPMRSVSGFCLDHASSDASFSLAVFLELFLSRVLHSAWI